MGGSGGTGAAGKPLVDEVNVALGLWEARFSGDGGEEVRLEVCEDGAEFRDRDDLGLLVRQIFGKLEDFGGVGRGWE